MKKAILFVVMLSLVAFVSVSIAADAPKAATTAAPAKAATTAPAPAKAVTTAPAKAASTAPAPVKMEKFAGSIKSVDAMAKSFVVAGKDKKEMTFVADDKTKIVKAKKDLTFADLKAGLKVHVVYKMEMDKAVATTVKVAGK